MSKAQFNLMVRVITNRIKNGEEFDEIIKDYPKLSADEVEQLRKACVTE